MQLLVITNSTLTSVTISKLELTWCGRKRKDEYDKLNAKVQEIKNESIPVENINQTKLMILLRWYRRDGDEKIPKKKDRSNCMIFCSQHCMHFQSTNWQDQ